jgi:hypothetical protein
VRATIVARFMFIRRPCFGTDGRIFPARETHYQEHTMADQAPSKEQDQLRINLQDEGSMHEWAKKLDATPEQLKEAVGAVGDLASDVEAHLKGSRSSVNSERVHNAL